MFFVIHRDGTEFFTEKAGRDFITKKNMDQVIQSDVFTS